MENIKLSTPCQITKTYNITNYDYRITNIFLNSSVHLVIVFKDEFGNYQKECSLNLYNEDYTNWGSDDNYIHTMIEKAIPTLL